MPEMEISKDKDVIELLNILNNNGMRQAAENIEKTIHYIDSMQDKLDEMISQVDEMRKELKTYNDLQNRSLGEKIKDSASQTKDKMVETIKVQITRAEDRIERMKEALIDAKDKFMTGVRDTLAAIKTRGKQGLNALIGITHIRQAFSFMKNDIDKGIRETETTIDKLTELGNELRAAKEMKKNAFRTFRGKEKKEYEHDKDSVFSIITTAPWKNQKKYYEAFSNLLDKGIKKMEQLAVDVAAINKEKAEARGEGIDESIGSVATQEKTVEEKTSHDELIEADVSPEFQLAVAEQKQDYHYNDEAFENYMEKNGLDEKKTLTAPSQVPEKKPEKR